MKHFFNVQNNVLRDLSVIIAVFLLASAVLYGYYQFFTIGKMDTIYRNWDGPGYIVVAKSFYDVGIITKVNPFPWAKPSDSAYVFPLAPLFIRLFSPLGYGPATIAVSQLFSLLYFFTLYSLIKTVNPKANALVIALLSIFYAPRWFILSHVGSAEPVLLFFLTLSLLFFMKRKFFLSAVSLMLAQLTKSQAIVFFLGVTIFFASRLLLGKRKSYVKVLKEYASFLMVPLAFAGIFLLFQINFGNFFAYMTTQETNVMVRWPPLLLLLIPVGYMEGWKEGLVYTYILYFIPIILLISKRMHFFVVLSMGYYFLMLFIPHGDIARYMTPLLPFLFVGLSDALSEKPVYTALFLCTPAVYLFAIAYMNMNLAPTF